VAEVARTLRQGGYLLAATNSERNMAEMEELISRAREGLGLGPATPLTRATHLFSLEGALPLMQRHFGQVERRDMPSALVFPAAGPVLDYVESSHDWYETQLATVAWTAFRDALAGLLEEHIARHGEFRVHKLAGVFVCRKV
jgi:hypothetical protein